MREPPAPAPAPAPVPVVPAPADTVRTGREPPVGDAPSKEPVADAGTLGGRTGAAEASGLGNEAMDSGCQVGRRANNTEQHGVQALELATPQESF